jgi:hypothetical protein
MGMHEARDASTQAHERHLLGDEATEATGRDQDAASLEARTARHRLERAGRRIELDDVDEVIGLAAELREREATELTLAELEEVGRELELDATYVHRAVEALDAKRREAAEASKQAERERVARRSMLARLVVACAVAGLLATIAVWTSGSSSQAELRAHHAEVEARRAQVINVVERKAATERQWRDAPAGPSRDAELSGAENRIRIERKRYDEAAARYNAANGGAFTRYWARRAGLPDRAPMSNEIPW